MAGKHFGRLPIEQQFDVLPVGAAEALPGPKLLALAGTEQVGQTAQLKLGSIVQLHPLRPMGELGIIAARKGAQPLKVSPPPLLDGLALHGKLRIEHFQQGRFFSIGTFWPRCRMAKQRVFLLQRPDVAAVDRQVAGVELAECRVQKLSPPFRRPFDKAQMAGVEDHRRKAARQCRCPLGRCSVHRGVPPRPGGVRRTDGHPNAALFFRLFQQEFFRVLCAQGRRFQYGEGFAPPHQFGILATPEAFAAGQQPDGLQKARSSCLGRYCRR